MRVGSVLKSSPNTKIEGAPRIFQILLFAVLPLEVLGVNGIPANEIAAVGIILAAFCRVPLPQTVTKWWIPALTIFCLWCLVSTVLAPAELNGRRLMHLVVWALLVMVIASGRVHYASMISGLALGLLIGSISGFLKVGSRGGYDGRLTGLFGDPNVAGLVLVVYGLMVMSLASSRWHLAVVMVSAVALVLTLSRTSMLALSIGLAWMVVATRIRWAFSLGLFAILIPLIFNLGEQLKNWGPFEEREGSDLLRERIIDSEMAVIAQSPFLGNGAGTAKVSVDGMPFFFHNSYLAMQAEFGMVAVVIYIIVAFAILMMMVQLPRRKRNIPLEMALIALGVCALNLGEVLLHLPAAVALGVAIRWAVIVRSERQFPNLGRYL